MCSAFIIIKYLIMTYIFSIADIHLLHFSSLTLNRISYAFVIAYKVVATIPISKLE